MSFWGAFIIANKGSWEKKSVWIAGGWLAIWCINLVRISLLVLAINNNWQMPLGLDHHTWFNIASYILILNSSIFTTGLQKKYLFLNGTKFLMLTYQLVVNGSFRWGI